MTGCDLLIGAAAVATATAPFLPWAKATLQPDPGQSLDGVVMAPQGTVTGIYAHPSLKAAMILAVLQLALLLARYYPGGRCGCPGTATFWRSAPPPSASLWRPTSSSSQGRGPTS